MFKLHMTIHTPVGVFSGYTWPTPCSLAEAETARDTMQEHNITSLTLYTKNEAGIELQTALKEAVLQQSVLVYEIHPAS